MGLFAKKTLPPPQGQSYDMDDIVKKLKPEDRVQGTPTLWELEEALEALNNFDRINVRLTRMQLKWAFKACSKHLQCDFKHPWQ